MILRSTGEKGVVVATWLVDGIEDCYVAFFGQEWPARDANPPKPYVLRYYSTSLEPADGRAFAPTGLVVTFAGDPPASSNTKKKRRRR